MRTPLLFALLLVLAPAAPTAHAAEVPRWGPSETVGRGGGTGYNGPSIDGNSKGFRAIAYGSGGRAMVATARDGGRFGRPIRVPGAALSGYDYAAEPGVEVDERGNALIVWSYDDPWREADEDSRFGEGCCVGVRFTVLRADGRFDPVRRLTPRGRSVFLVEADIAEGRVGLAWSEERDGTSPSKPGLLVYTQDGGGRRGRTQIVDAGGETPAALSFLRGRARVLYERGGSTRDLLEAIEQPDGSFAAPRVVAPGVGESFRNPQVATAPSGRQAIAYIVGPSGAEAVYAGTRLPGRSFRIQRIAAAELGITDPFAAVARNGAAAVVWPDPSETGTHVNTSFAPAGGAFRKRERPFRHAPDGAAEVRAAIGPRGTVAVAWMHDPDNTLRSAFVTPDGKRTRPTVLGRERFDEVFYEPEMFVDDSGRALIAHVSRGTIRVNRGLAP